MFLFLAMPAPGPAAPQQDMRRDAAARYGVSDKGRKARKMVFSMALLLFRAGEFSDRYGQPG